MTTIKLTSTPTKGRLTYMLTLGGPRRPHQKPLMKNGTFSLENGVVTVHDGDKRQRFTDAGSVVAFELY